MAFALPAVLRFPNFRYLMITRLCGVLALQAQAVIVGWQLFSITKDPLMLGLIGLTEAVPALCAALFAGHFVDTHDPRKIYISAYIVLVINTLFLLATAGGLLSLDHAILIPCIFTGVFFSGIARSVIMPSSFKLLSHIVPRDEIPQASACMSSAYQFGAVASPAVAGLVYAAFGSTVAWIMPAALMLVALTLSLQLKVPHTEIAPESREPILQSIKAGWTYILGSPVLLSVMALDMFAVLFGGAIAMLPAVAETLLQTGSEGLGILRAAPALGSGIMGLYLAMNPMKCITGRRLLFVVGAFGLCMIGFGLSHWFWLSCLFLIASGAFDSVSMVIRGTLMQWLTPDAMRGRISSVNSMFIISSNEIGAFESGVAAKLMGLAPSIVFGGGMSVFISSLMAWRVSSLWNLRIDPNSQKDQY